eukprot:334033-Rhodomonas_salina.2
MFSERAGRERALDLDIHQAPSKCQLKLFILTILHLHGCEKGAETKKDERWVQRARRRERDANTFVSGSRHSFQLLPESNTSSQHLFTASCFLHSPRPAAHPLRVLGPDATTLFQLPGMLLMVLLRSVAKRRGSNLVGLLLTMTAGYGAIASSPVAVERPRRGGLIVHAMGMAAVASVLLAIALVSANAAQQNHQHSLLQAYYLVPLQQGPPNMFYNQHQQQQQQQGRYPIVYMDGPSKGTLNMVGDLPIPIEYDGDQDFVAPGSNIHMFEHGVPPIPYGMDDRPDPPYIPGRR